MCSLKGYGFNLETFLKFNDPRTFPRMRDVLPRLFSPSLGNVARPSTPDEDILSQSSSSSPREESNQCTPDQDVPSQSVPSSPREESNQCTPDQDVSSQSAPSSPRQESNQCTPDQDVSSQSVPSSPREESNQCTPDQDVSSQSVPSSPRKGSNQCTPDQDVSSQSVPSSPRKGSNQSCPSLIQTVSITFSETEPLDKNLTSSSLQTMCDGTATKGHVMDSWLHSWCKNIHTMDAWDTAVKHSSKPTVNSAISWTDEELISIEDSLSGFSTGSQPVAASVMFYVLCAVLCVLTATGTILFHSALTTEAALWWLVCVTVGVVFHVLVLEPIKAVLILAYVSTTSKKLY